jgi:hypothetical protein
MPPIPTRTLKPHPLPAGGVWFLRREEAETRKGIQVEVSTSIAHFYGVYRDLEALSHHARNFLIQRQGTETYAQVEEISQMYFEFPLGLRRELGIPLAGRWFVHEKGARAAALGARDPFVTSIILRSEGEDDTTIWACYASKHAFVVDLAKCCATLAPGRRVVLVTA